MKRSVLAFCAGLLAWVLVVSLIDRLLRVVLPGYEAAEPRLLFTLPMMIARLSMAAVTSLIAGAVIGWVAPASTRIPWILGGLLLLGFLPSHVRLWEHFPVWYHLAFLLPLAPLIVLGARVRHAPVLRVA